MVVKPCNIEHMCCTMNNDLNKTWRDCCPSLDFSEPGLYAADDPFLALLWRRDREAGVKGLCSRHCEDKLRRSNLSSALLWRRDREAGVKGLLACHSAHSEESMFGNSKLADPSQNKLRMTKEKNKKSQIAAQMRLAMTVCDGPRCTRTAPTKRAHMQNLQAVG